LSTELGHGRAQQVQFGHGRDLAGEALRQADVVGIGAGDDLVGATLQTTLRAPARRRFCGSGTYCTGTPDSSRSWVITASSSSGTGPSRTSTTSSGGSSCSVVIEANARRSHSARSPAYTGNSTENAGTSRSAASAPARSAS